MKHAYSFLAGAALISLCVLFTRSLPGYMFGLGFCLCLGCFLLLHVKGIIRLVPHWSSGTKGSSCQSSIANSVESVSTVGVVSVAARSKASSERLPRRVNVNELPARRYPRSARNGGSRSVVQSPETGMLNTVQQEVLSALCNLKVPFSEAQQAVCSASKEHGGESFDQLFRVALNLVNAGAGKSRKAA